MDTKDITQFYLITLNNSFQDFFKRKNYIQSRNGITRSHEMPSAHVWRDAQDAKRPGYAIRDLCQA